MPSNIMDQRRLSFFHMPSAPSSFFSDETCFPFERQFGIWKPESMPDHHGTGGMSLMSGIQSVSLSPQEKLCRMGGNSVECLQLPQAYALKDQETKISLERHLMGVESTTTLSLTSWRARNQDFGSRTSLYVQPASQFMTGNKVVLNGLHYENDLLSSCLSEMFNKKLSFSSNGAPSGQSVDTSGNDEPSESLEEIEAQTIGNLLPDDDDLLSGVIDDLARPNSGDDVEDDLFCSGGGMELEADDIPNSNKTSDFVGGGASNGQLGGLSIQFSGEHPSRTLFIRNINSNVVDAELRDLFEQHGEIHELYTACKHRGFVVISYYDIRAAQNAMKALANKPFRGRNLDIHFSIPKDNPLETNINQGTLVVFNLDSSISNDDLHQIFGVYGEVKEILETPHKHHHKFIEFYDVRAVETALRALNKNVIAGKRIKLEPSCNGARQCLIPQLYPDLDQEELSGCMQGRVPSTSSECFVSSGSIALGAFTSNGLEKVPIQGLAGRAPVSPFMGTTSHGISSSVAHNLCPPVMAATVGKHNNQSGPGDLSRSLRHRNFGYQCAPTFHPHSLPEYHDTVNTDIPFNPPSTLSAMDFINSRPADRNDNRHIHHRIGSGGLDNHSFGHHEGAFGVLGNGSFPLHGHEYVGNTSETYHLNLPGAMMWRGSPSFVKSIPSHSPQQMHGVPRAPSHMPSTILPSHHHYVGSAPAVDPSLWDSRHSYAADSMEASAIHPGSLGSIGFSGSSSLHPLEVASSNLFPCANGNCVDPSMSSAHVGIASPQQRCQFFNRRNKPGSHDSPPDRVRSRRSDGNANQVDNNKHYELDIDRIMRGVDSRTTLMIKNIPNKYTSKMLLATIDEHHRGTYDFIYLPIDFKNKCNVGYAFINMIDPQHIIQLFQAFNGKKWEKFNSEKVASLKYARIQSKAALITHFQNSSLMNEDKRCRPILFHTDGPNAGDQEPFPMGANVRSRPGKSRTAGGEEVHQGSPPNCLNVEESSNAPDDSGI